MSELYELTEAESNRLLLAGISLDEQERHMAHLRELIDLGEGPVDWLKRSIES